MSRALRPAWSAPRSRSAARSCSRSRAPSSPAARAATSSTRSSLRWVSSSASRPSAWWPRCPAWPARGRPCPPRRRFPAVAERRIAIADLGSNTFRLVVFTTGEGWWRRTDEIYEGVRIGEGLASTGELGPEPIRRALAAADVFAHFCRATGIDEVEAVATSAIRDASNRDEFISRSALPVRVLSAQEEAHFGYLAAVNSTTLADGCVLDLGGGSLQLTRVVSRLAREERSWKLGAVRMTERFGEDRKALRKHVAAKIEAVSGNRLVAIGGTARNLAA